MFNIKKSETFSWDAVNNISRAEVMEFIALLQNQLQVEITKQPAATSNNQQPVTNALPFEIANKGTERRLTWHEAQAYTETLGNDWRLPTKEELDIMYQSNKITSNCGYWSSKAYKEQYAWMQYFNNGDQYTSNKSNKFYVRAVRDRGTI